MARALVTLALMALGALTRAAPAALVEEDPFARFGNVVAGLPSPLSEAFPCGPLLAPLTKRQPQGIIELPTANFWPPEDLFTALQQSLPRPAEIDLITGTWKRVHSRRAHFDVLRKMDDARLHPFRALVDWMTAVVLATFPEEGPFRLYSAGLRVGTATEAVREDNLHIDGAYVAAGLSLLGSGSLYFPRFRRINPTDLKRMAPRIPLDGSRVAAKGNLLLMTCRERMERLMNVEGSVHRSPLVYEPRLFLIVRYRRATSPLEANERLFLIGDSYGKFPRE